MNIRAPQTSIPVAGPAAMRNWLNLVIVVLLLLLVPLIFSIFLQGEN